MDRCGRRARVAFAAALVAAVAGGCGVSAFACEGDAQCQDDGIPGTCEPSGGCSFPDPACPSGRRYGQHAPSDLGGECVPLDVGTESTDGGTVSTTVTSATATSTSVGTLDDDDGTTMGVSATVATSVDASSGSGEVDTGATVTTGAETGESTGGDPTGFFDPFDRPDGAALGNGWIEKTPGAFRILDEQVELESVNGQDFRDNLFYRPLDESLLDVEVTMTVNFFTDEPFGYPQMHLRVQAEDIVTPLSLTSYAVFVDSGDPMVPQLTVNRIAGPDFGPAVSEPIEPPPVDAETYRLRGRVTGTDPVVLEGFFEVWDGNAWEVRTEATLMDAAPDRITTAGTVGAGGHLELDHFALDDFGVVPLGN